MFKSVFNLKFNLNKAYTDIGILDDDANMQAAIYGIHPADIDDILHSFHEENKKNARKVLEHFPAFAPQTTNEVHIAYLGDSITSDRNSHQNIIKYIFESYNNIIFHDFAISGYKSSDIFTAFYPNIADVAPDIAVMMIGTNDMRITNDKYHYYHTQPKEFERYLHYIIENLQAMDCKIILCTLPPFDQKKIEKELDGWKILFTEEGREIFDHCIIRAAEKYRTDLVDMRKIYTSYAAADITIEDGLHLNPRGQTLLAQQVFSKLAPLTER